MKAFMFIGRSGCGKGTQAKLLKSFLEGQDNKEEVVYAYAGDNLRKLIAKGGHTSNLAGEIMKTGGKQPDFLADWAWSDCVIDNITINSHLIIDGSPRSLVQAKIIDEALEFYKFKTVHPILIDVSRGWAKERLLGRGRSDDTDGQIDSRLDYYDGSVVPAVEYFESESKNKLIKINGEQSVEEVHGEILQAIFNF